MVVSKPLSEFEKLLTGNNFLRIHKSHLINLNCVKEYIKGKGGHVIMIDGTKLEVSPKHKSELLDLLKKI